MEISEVPVPEAKAESRTSTGTADTAPKRNFLAMVTEKLRARRVPQESAIVSSATEDLTGQVSSKSNELSGAETPKEIAQHVRHRVIKQTELDDNKHYIREQADKFARWLERLKHESGDIFVVERGLQGDRPKLNSMAANDIGFALGRSSSPFGGELEAETPSGKQTLTQEIWPTKARGLFAGELKIYTHGRGELNSAHFFMLADEALEARLREDPWDVIKTPARKFPQARLVLEARGKI